MMASLRGLRRLVMGSEGSVKTRVVRSGIWVGVGNLVTSVLGVLRSVVLARLLTPEMFGLMGLAGVAIRTVETVTRPGIVQALIARQRDFAEAAPTAFALLIVRGVLLSVALALVAPLVGTFYEAEQLEAILRVLAVVFLIGGLANIQTIARQKELDFRRLTYLSLTTTVLSTMVTLTAAFMWRSVWALVIGQIANSLAHAVLSYWFLPGRIVVDWNGAIARELLRYGKFITGSSIVLFVANELDSAVIGKMLGVEQLGYYALAFTIADLATAALSRTASRIMMPAYSQLQSEPATLHRAFLRTINLVMHLVLPASVALALLAEPLIRLVYGDRWLPAVIPLQIFTIFGVARAIVAFNGYLFEGTGRPQLAFRLGALRLAIIAPLIIPMIGRFGLTGAAATVLIGMTVQCCAALWYLRRHVGIRLTSMARAVSRPIWSTAVMAAVIVAAGVLMPVADLLHFAAVVLIGLVVYVAVNWSVVTSLRRERLG